MVEKSIARAALHLYPSTFEHESRILKETKSLIDYGLVNKIFIAAVWEPDLEPREQIDEKREVLRIKLKTKNLKGGFWSKALQYYEWTLKVFFVFKKEKIDFVNCHSLRVLPLGMLFKIFCKSKVIYDTHELETETCGLSRLVKFLLKILERLLIHHVDRIVVVSNSIAEWYKNQYGLRNIYIIRNFPDFKNHKFKKSNILKEKFKIGDNEILYIYQGLLDTGRGIEILLKCFSKIDENKHLVFLGYGPLEKIIKEYESKFSNIHFHPAVKTEEVINYSTSADVGISLIENTCLSYFLSLPNKFFEYILSGLPVIVSDFPEMKEIIDKKNCGWKVKVEESPFLELIKNISIKDINDKKENVLKCKDDFNWEEESKKILKIYQTLLTNN
jgi:glycosyltransferase involved in cell wall biosynthesis